MQRNSAICREHDVTTALESYVFLYFTTALEIINQYCLSLTLTHSKIERSSSQDQSTTSDSLVYSFDMAHCMCHGYCLFDTNAQTEIPALCVHYIYLSVSMFH